MNICHPFCKRLCKDSSLQTVYICVSSTAAKPARQGRTLLPAQAQPAIQRLKQPQKPTSYAYIAGYQITCPYAFPQLQNPVGRQRLFFPAGFVLCQLGLPHPRYQPAAGLKFRAAGAAAAGYSGRVAPVTTGSRVAGAKLGQPAHGAFGVGALRRVFAAAELGR